MLNRSSIANGQARRAVFIDRDGVINRMFFHAEFGITDSPANPDQFELLPGVAAAIAEFNRLGLLAVVVSNQPGIAKGKFTLALLEAMEGKMIAGIQSAGGGLDAIYNCLHHPEALLEQYRERCDCRKPEPGLLVKAARDFNIDLSGSYMIGDGATDIMAGRAAKTTTLFVSSRKCYNCDSLIELGAWPDYIVSDLSEAAVVIRSLEAGDKDSVQKFVFSCAAPQIAAS
jgi:D-glycero-D-manno-heptose 1,7-bisphosphate phosphatase